MYIHIYIYIEREREFYEYYNVCVIWYIVYTTVLVMM